MKTPLLSLLCLFVWKQTAEALTEQRLVLGQNVTLACEFHLKAVIWFVMKLPGRPEMILRTFGPPKQVEYYNKKFISKYSEGDWSHLFINNVSAYDLGIYYCIKPGHLEVSNGIRLHTSESPPSHNEPEQKDQTALQILIIMFSLLTVVLFAAVIGLLMINHKLSKKISEYVNGRQISTMRFHESNRGKTDSEYLEVLPNIRGPVYETVSY
uniref:Immunoglobulin domain-containing protein n=1 Tax=Cyprinus carpio TaxID=7962 RepID=A0A8C2K4K6_CYPCA